MLARNGSFEETVVVRAGYGMVDIIAVKTYGDCLGLFFVQNDVCKPRNGS